MLTSADKVDGWVKNGQKHADVILEWSLSWPLRISTVINCLRPTMRKPLEIPYFQTIHNKCFTLYILSNIRRTHHINCNLWIKKMKLYNIIKAFTCCIPAKKSENSPADYYKKDRYNPLLESPTFVKDGQNIDNQKTGTG